MAGEADNGELIHVHRLFSSDWICCPKRLGAPESKRPRSQGRRSALLGGPACRMRFEASTGEPRKQNGAERRARGFKRSSAQDRKGDRDRRRTDQHERAHMSDKADQCAVMADPRTHAATELVEGKAGRIRKGRTKDRGGFGRGSSEESTARDAQRTGKQHRSQRDTRMLGRTAAGTVGWQP
jgi:hypothetical protein